MVSIKQQVIDYRNQNPQYRTLLGTLLGEFDRIQGTSPLNPPTDNQCIQTIKKFIENNKIVNTQESLLENKVLTKFIPQQLSTEQVESIIRREKFTSIKDCMDFFKVVYSGLYDGKVVSNCFRNM